MENEKKFLVFYENIKKGCISSYFVYGEDELRRELKHYDDESEKEEPNSKLLDVIELLDYRNVDVDKFMGY